MDKNFHNFYRLLSSKLSEVGLDGIMPVGLEEGPSMVIPPYCFEEECFTWASTLEPFTAALLWFERLYHRVPEETAADAFDRLSSQEKAFIQRGYQMIYQGRFPPRYDGMKYVLPYELTYEKTDHLGAFPCIRPIPEEEYVHFSPASLEKPKSEEEQASSERVEALLQAAILKRAGHRLH